MRKTTMEDQIQTQNMRLGIKKYVIDKLARGDEVDELLLRYLAGLEDQERRGLRPYDLVQRPVELELLVEFDELDINVSTLRGDFDDAV